MAEIDDRRLYLGQGCSSLFTYCTQVLHLSEHAAYGRIEAARTTRRFPVILPLLMEGSLTLTAVGLLKPHLTEENHGELLGAARYKSKRNVEHLVACIHPKPAAQASVRKLPVPAPPPGVSTTEPTARTEDDNVVELGPLKAPTQPPVVKPIAPAIYKVQFSVGADTYQKLRRAQELLRHTIPNGDPAEILIARLPC